MPAALARFPSRSMTSPGSVPVPRPMPSCGFAPALLFGSNARRFRASIPGRRCARSRSDLTRLPQGSPLGSSPPPPWLTVLIPGHPLVRFPRCPRERTSRGAPESCVAAESACRLRLPTLLGSSTSRSRGVFPPRPTPVLKERRRRRAALTGCEGLRRSARLGVSRVCARRRACTSSPTASSTKSA